MDSSGEFASAAGDSWERASTGDLAVHIAAVRTHIEQARPR